MTSTLDISAPRPGTAAADNPGGAGPGTVLRRDDPATGEALPPVAASSADDVARAFAAARAASEGWRRTSPAERGAALRAAAAAVRSHAEELALWTTREMGKPLADARGGVQAGASTLEQYAELGPVHRGRSLLGGWSATDLMVPEPHGVVAVITPWNDPVAVAAGLLGAALVMGNTVVHKPSERTPATGELLARLLADELPDGVLSVVQGGPEVGERVLDGRPDLVAHVGSTRAGRRVVQRAAAPPLHGDVAVLRENGGKDPLLVDAGVDPRWAAAQAALGAFANAGQICTSVERVYVHRAVADAFLEALVAEARARVLGPGTNPSTTLGPLVDVRARAEVHAQVTAAVEAGAQLLTGGTVPAGPGAFYPATVLAGCTGDMAVMTEETFGPVAPVRVVDSFEQAVEEAARSSYGLAATVLTPDQAHAQHAWRELPVGTVKVNAVFGGAPGGAAQPRRGSGQGFGYGPELLDEMSLTKVVHLAVAPVSP